MTRARTPVERLGIALALLLYCFTAGATPVIDARLEAAALTAASHIEAEGGGPSCSRAHDHLACQLCRTVRTGAAPPSATPICSRILVWSATAVVPSGFRPDLALPAPLGPRAPPLS